MRQLSREGLRRQVTREQMRAAIYLNRKRQEEAKPTRKYWEVFSKQAGAGRKGSAYPIMSEQSAGKEVVTEEVRSATCLSGCANQFSIYLTVFGRAKTLSDIRATGKPSINGSVWKSAGMCYIPFLIKIFRSFRTSINGCHFAGIVK